MKIRTLLLAVLTVAGLNVSAHNEYKLDANSGTVKWLGEKVGGEHSGEISIQSGSLTLHAGKLAGVEVTMDMNSITCTDIEDEEYNAKLVGHLKNDDFFSTDAHPTAHFKSTAVKLVDEATGKYEVTGDMTIKGKTNSETVTVYVKTENGEVKASAEFNIDRTKYGVEYGSKSIFDNLGDKFIYDEFKITMDVVAKQ